MRIDSNAVHLAYKLEVALEPGHAQAVFKVESEGDMAISIKASGALWIRAGAEGRIDSKPLLVASRWMLDA